MATPQTRPLTIPERIRELRSLMAAFTVRPIDPANPDEAALYFPFHKDPGRPRGRDPVMDLRKTIFLLPEQETCQLFSGFQGTGKSTELRRLAGELKDAGFLVLFVEGGRYINLYQPLEISDLLLAVAAAVGEAIEEMVGQSPLRQQLTERMVEFFSRIKLTQIDVGLSAAMGLDQAGKVNLDVAKLRLELTQNPSFKTRVQDALRGTLRVFLDAFTTFMNDARALMTAAGGPCPVLIIDDLEKVQGSGDKQQDTVQRQIEQIFSAFNAALKIPGWHTIWASPPYLPFLNTSIASLYDGYTVLPMVRLWSEKDPRRAPDAASLEAMRKFLRLRGRVDSLVESEALLDELILSSSGHVRDLCRLMQDLLREVDDADPNGRVGEAGVRRIIADYVDTSQKAIYTDDLAFLRSVADTRRVDATNATQIQRVAKLFDTQLVMVYRNGNEWFDVSVPVQRRLAR